VAETWCGTVSNGQKPEETVTREEGPGGRVRVAAVPVAFIVHALKEARREEGRKEGRQAGRRRRRRRRRGGGGGAGVIAGSEKKIQSHPDDKAGELIDLRDHAQLQKPKW
jgi:hypothetical protein